MPRPRPFITIAVSAAALAVGAGPLMAGNITTQESGDIVTRDTVLANADLKPHGADDVLVFDVNDMRFDKGVKITKSENTKIQFNGSATFNLLDENADKSGDNSLDINQIIFAKKAEGSAPNILTVIGNELEIGAAEMIVDTDLKVNFENGGKISPIDKLSLGVNSVSSASLSFNGGELLEAGTLNIGQAGARINGPAEIGSPAGEAIKSGLKAKDMSINKDTYINGPLTGGGDGVFTFNRKASIFLGGDGAQSSNLGQSSITIGAGLIDEAAQNPGIDVLSFKPFDITDPSAPGMPEAMKRLAASLSVAEDTVFPNNGYGEAVYDKDNGYLVLAYYGSNPDNMAKIPTYGVPFVKALYEAADQAGEKNHKALAVAIMGAAKTADVSEDLNTLMGNVPNAAISAALSGNMNQVMGHLNSTMSPVMPGFAGPQGASQGLWISPAYSLTDIKGSPKEGYGDAEIKNPAVTFGYDRWVNDRIRLGVFAAVSRPETEGSNQSISTENLQAGLYGQARLNYGINVNMGLAYSTQSHDAERKIPADILAGTTPFAAQSLSSSFGGAALSAALEVSRLYPLAANSFIRPTVAYNYVAAGTDGYSEKSDAAAPGDSLAQKAESTDFTLQLVRVGAEGGWSNDLTTVTGRLFWVGNLGDTQPRTKASLISGGSAPFSIMGAEYDKNMVNIGLGVKYAPPQTNGLTFGLNYDALMGSSAKNHSLSLMMRYEF